MARSILVLGSPPPVETGLIRSLANRFNVVFADNADGFGAAIGDAAALLHWEGGREELREVLRRAPQLECVHFRFAGIDGFICDELKNGKFTVTNGRGLYAPALAEFVLGSILYFSRDFPRLARAKAARNWDEHETETLHGKTLGIIGYGEIGRAVASLARVFGMRVVGLRRRPEKSASDPFAERVYGAGELRKVCEESDYLVVSAALTDQSRNILGAKEIAALKREAVLINVGRGGSVDEPALICALEDGRIRGAALDVFTEEPLPSSSPLWVLENVIISPHTADQYPGWLEPPAKLFVENAIRFHDGKTLQNIVNPREGY